MSKRGRTFHEQPQFKKLSHALHRVYSHKSAVLLTAMVGIMPFQPYAAELDTTLPKSNASTGSFAPSNIDIPSQPLDAALKQLARTTGISVAFDSNLATGKTAPAVKGRMKADEALRLLLAGSGLESTIDKDNAVIKPAAEKSAIDFQQVDAVEVRAKRFYEIGPLPGLGLTKEEIPGNVQSITAKEIKEAHSLSMADLFNRKLQSVTVNDYQGNPFQMDVQYRGFTAGPQIGSPQGLSVFFDGIRVNEPFGDVVNWDMIPMNAIATVDVFPGSNPIFGLNTLGGAFTVKTKDGFNNTGFDAEILTGSYGRKQLQAEGGWNNGTIAGFAAANIFMEDGWRENSPSKVNQVFGKGSYRGDKLDLNLSTLVIWNDLVGNGVLPSEMYKQDRNSVFTSPDTTDNRLWQGQLSGSYFVNDNFTITGQIYRRNSKRRQKGADVFTDYDQELKSYKKSVSDYTCLFNSNNSYGLPDYIVIPVENYDPNTNNIFTSSFFADLLDGDGINPNDYSAFINTELSGDFLAAVRDQTRIFRNFTENVIYNRDIPNVAEIGSTSTNYFDEPIYNANLNFPYASIDSGGLGVASTTFENYFFTTDTNGNITKNYYFVLPATNESSCLTTQASGLEQTDSNGNPILVDGIGLGQPGVVDGTPTAVFTDNQVNQITDGASIQFNWNFEKHKLMIGASIDDAHASYSNTQQLGFLTAKRKAFLDPNLANPQFAGADITLANNDFDGTNTTKSIYFSENWTPIESLHLSFSGRYNETQVKNKIAARRGLANYGIGDVGSLPWIFDICPNGNCDGIETGYRIPQIYNELNSAETEKFSYYSFNPSLGATWQAKENLNLYVNLAKGTRTPSVVELGCALDHSPTGIFYSDGQGGSYEIPKSLLENRQCTLPTTMSGDPYLPQIKSTSYDIGVRGTINENIKWNFGLYQTDLKDDIYYVNVGNNQGFFDTVGKTRRRGIETGISGIYSKFSFSLNYALTDATFEDDFLMISRDNSSSFSLGQYGEVIRVKPGSRMPGVALHNLNASINYAVTDKWTVGLSAVAHSESFVRGNENNEHRQGVTRYRQLTIPGIGATTVARQPTSNPGTVDGYFVFNFQTSYKINTEWTASLLINNLLDKEYFSAGRLGHNPFSPSIYGAIGPDGYNHNSGDWLSTNFVAPGAPRGIWFSLRYEFDSRK
ncbi:TonB-dependent receptor domain-containing protein [Methylobacillus sp. Pita1]|uniref:TonB-dependent receptor domain-containing protein n=1 Tax=Methylobacillus sp. Pita1 TaxID=3382642 RepID=UPI0038B62D7F